MSVAPVRVGLLHDMPEMHVAADLLRDVWGGDEHPVQAALLMAQAHAGNYVAGAWQGDRLVGASMGFLADPGGVVLHSHITGVVAGASGRGVGRALKDHQAAWCRDHDIATVTWTFDPLVARNAWFNVGRLGVAVQDYLVDFYGEMPDERNRGQGSDRLLVAWDVHDPRVAAVDPPGPDEAVAVTVGPAGDPVVADPGDADVVWVAIPSDVEAVRARDPACAVRWRRAVRTALGDRIARRPGDPAWRVAGVARTGHYRLVPTG